MAKVRVRGQEKNGTGAIAEGQAAASPIPLRPMPISGVVVGKADLLAALQVYGPFEDVEVFEDGQRFLLKLRPEAAT
ncbi:MAG: hypothetical protein HY331_11700 [Chloroflexi bacterium]|nr:hypothetical protein [Chloroflexota bacterium]